MAFESFAAQYPDLAALAVKLAEPRVMLEQALANRQQLEGELPKRRFAVGMIDVLSDNGIRDMRFAALAAQTDGRLAETLFPDGLTAIIRLRGSSQVGEMRELEHRLEALQSKWPGAAEWLQKIGALREQYVAAIGAVDQLMDAIVAARVAANNARLELVLAFARVSGEVKRIFPRNTRMQDVFFDKFRSARAGEEDDEDAVDAPVSPAA